MMFLAHLLLPATSCEDSPAPDAKNRLPNRLSTPIITLLNPSDAPDFFTPSLHICSWRQVLVGQARFMASDNPYEPPTIGSRTSPVSAVGACPQCNRRFGFLQIAFATHPLRLTCPACKARLVGGPLCRLQGVCIVSVSIIVVMLNLWAFWPPTLGSILKVFGISIAVLIPYAAFNTLITMKWGRYSLREK